MDFFEYATQDYIAFKEELLLDKIEVEMFNEEYELDLIFLTEEEKKGIVGTILGKIKAMIDSAIKWFRNIWSKFVGKFKKSKPEVAKADAQVKSALKTAENAANAATADNATEKLEVVQKSVETMRDTGQETMQKVKKGMSPEEAKQTAADIMEGGRVAKERREREAKERKETVLKMKGKADAELYGKLKKVTSVNVDKSSSGSSISVTIIGKLYDGREKTIDFNIGMSGDPIRMTKSVEKEIDKRNITFANINTSSLKSEIKRKMEDFINKSNEGNKFEDVVVAKNSKGKYKVSFKFTNKTFSVTQLEDEEDDDFILDIFNGLKDRYPLMKNGEIAAIVQKVKAKMR